MNENSKLTTQQWLKFATNQLGVANITTSRLDALVLLGHILGKDKSWLLAHPEHIIDSFAKKRLSALLARRIKREPLAYLVGHKEFYGRDFKVSRRVLIPRPESEGLIDMLKELPRQPGQMLVDVGTGSGALAVTAALECPELKVYATDIDKNALAIANHNARQHKVRLQYHTADLLGDCFKPNPNPYLDFIIANLPYVDPGWERSPETNYEPRLALFAEDEGLALIKKLMVQAAERLKPNGYLLLEADPRQHKIITTLAKTSELHNIKTQNFTICLQKRL